MADLFAGTALPGPGGVDITNERSALLGPITWYLLKGIVITSVASDATNTPTTELRHGLLMGQRTADGFYSNYNPQGTDGTQQTHGFLWEARTMIDSDGNAVNRSGQLVVAAYARASQLLLLDEQARRQMQGRFLFDDRLVSPIGGYKQTLAKTANYAVVAGQDNDTIFTTTGNAAAITFALPTPAVGNRFRFINTVNQNMTITAPANKLVALNNATATNIAFTTAANMIGAGVEIVCDDTGTKWLAMPLGTATATIS